jgi:hypothetical protein
MKIYWFNNKESKIEVFVNDMSDPEVVLDRGTGQYIEINVPVDHDIFIKEWDYGYVLISSAPKKAFE